QAADDGDDREELDESETGRTPTGKNGGHGLMGVKRWRWNDGARSVFCEGAVLAKATAKAEGKTEDARAGKHRRGGRLGDGGGGEGISHRAGEIVNGASIEIQGEVEGRVWENLLVVASVDDGRPRDADLLLNGNGEVGRNRGVRPGSGCSG